MTSIAPLNTIRFGFSDRQYSLGTAEEVGPGTRFFRNVLQKVLPYTLQETDPAQQFAYADQNQPIHFYYVPQNGKPGEYRLYLNA